MTLIEILVVLVLIGIVLGIVGGNFIGKGEKAKADAARIEIGQISQTLDLYKLEIGRYPSSQEGLQALISAPAGTANWNGPYWKAGRAAQGSLGQRVQVRRAGHEGSVRHHLARRRRQGRRRGRRQGHLERAMIARASPPDRRARAAARGVTLLELLIVLSIMAIVAAMTYPRIGGGVSTTELKTAARQMAAALRLARSDALATRRESFVTIDLERRVFRLDRDAREIALPKDVELKLFTAQRDLHFRQGRGHPLLPRRRSRTAAG